MQRLFVKSVLSQDRFEQSVEPGLQRGSAFNSFVLPDGEVCQRLGQAVSLTAELAELADVTVAKIEAARAARTMARVVPLHGDPDEGESGLGGHGDATSERADMGDMLARLTDGREVESAITFEEDYDAALSSDTPVARVADALDALAPPGADAWRRRARAAIEMRWGLGADAPPIPTAASTVTFKDIGDELGVSREQARKWVTCGEEFCREWLRSVGRTPDA